MPDQPPVVINKPKSVWHTIFVATGLAIVAVAACVTVISVSAISEVGDKYDETLSWAGNISENLKDWREILPPAIADAANDERNLEYATKVETTCEFRTDQRNRPVLVVTVTNNGDKVISLAALRLTLFDEKRLPVWEHASYAATPIAAENEWRGPLLPGNTRTYSQNINHHYYFSRNSKATAEVEVVELRTWVGPLKPTVAQAIEEEDSQSDAPLTAPDAIAKRLDQLSKEMNQSLANIPDPQAREEARREIDEGLREARNEIEQANARVEKAKQKAAEKAAKHR